MQNKFFILYALVASIFFLYSCDNNIDKSKLAFRDYRHFNGTVAERLAQAVRTGDTTAIKKEILENHVPVDLRTEKYNSTLLMMATSNNNLRSVKCLLELGADPNLYYDTINMKGTNSVIMASSFGRYFDDTEILREILKHGGDPNSQAKGVDFITKDKRVPYRVFALQEAAKNSLEKVKILVEARADINKTGKDGQDTALLSITQRPYTGKYGYCLVSS